MGEERSFKISAVGGFNRKDVIEYIEQLLAQLEEERAENRRKDERINELERRLEQYEQACSVSGDCSDEIMESDDMHAQIDAILSKYLGKED